jgi:hypothetical protein
LNPTLNGHQYPDYFGQKGHYPDYPAISGNWY